MGGACLRLTIIMPVLIGNGRIYALFLEKRMKLVFCGNPQERPEWRLLAQNVCLRGFLTACKGAGQSPAPFEFPQINRDILENVSRIEDALDRDPELHEGTSLRLCRPSLVIEPFPGSRHHQAIRIGADEGRA